MLASLPSRRRFLQQSAAAAGFAILPSRARAESSKARIKFAVIGLNHEHIFRMTQAVRQGGGELAMIFAADADPHHGVRFLQANSGVPVAREEREVLEAPDIHLIVSAARPDLRAGVAMRAMRAGKDVLVDKGGFLTLAELDQARRIQREMKRRFFVSFNERLLVPVNLEVDRLLRAGAIGRPTHFRGFGPHGLFGHGPREEWFWSRAAKGGILIDIGAHQADQFLHFIGGANPRLQAAQTGNLQNPDHPEFEDYGQVWWQSDAGTAEAIVTFTRQKSPGMSFGITGTSGQMEVEKNSGRITLTSRTGEKQVLQSNIHAPCPFGTRVVDDVLQRTETAMTTEHAFAATELALRAQLAALATTR